MRDRCRHHSCRQHPGRKSRACPYGYEPVCNPSSSPHGDMLRYRFSGVSAKVRCLRQHQPFTVLTGLAARYGDHSAGQRRCTLSLLGRDIDDPLNSLRFQEPLDVAGSLGRQLAIISISTRCT